MLTLPLHINWIVAVFWPRTGGSYATTPPQSSEVVGCGCLEAALVVLVFVIPLLHGFFGLGASSASNCATLRFGFLPEVLGILDLLFECS